MLPCKYRLKEEWRIKKILKSRRARHSSSFVLNWGKNDLNYSRFAFLASKKVGKATKRNRGLRLLRVAVWKCLNKFPVGFDFILVVRKGIVRQKMPVVKEELERILLEPINGFAF